ncbi:MAG: CHAD domain-containing protein, partial [Gemmataceae bacterium]|nr:CHAD domain-containing protein [Gemmataceae bacterium]
MTTISGAALAGKFLAEWRALGRALTRVGTTRSALTEATHDLRVCSRRTREAYRWARLTCPRVRGLKSFLRDARAAAGPFRDADVIGHRLMEYTAAKPTAGWGMLLGIWAAERERALAGWLRRAAQLPKMYSAWNK